MELSFNVTEIKKVIEHGNSVRLSLVNGSSVVIYTDESDDRNCLYNFFAELSAKNKSELLDQARARIKLEN